MEGTQVSTGKSEVSVSLPSRYRIAPSEDTVSLFSISFLISTWQL